MKRATLGSVPRLSVRSASKSAHALANEWKRLDDKVASLCRQGCYGHDPEEYGGAL